MTDEIRVQLLESARYIDHALRYELDDDTALELRQMAARLREMAARTGRGRRMEYRPLGSVA